MGGYVGIEPVTDCKFSVSPAAFSKMEPGWCSERNPSNENSGNGAWCSCAVYGRELKEDCIFFATGLPPQFVALSATESPYRCTIWTLSQVVPEGIPTGCQECYNGSGTVSNYGGQGQAGWECYLRDDWV